MRPIVVDPNLTTPLIANLCRLGLPYTAENLNDLIARATRSRWSPTVLLETLVQAELDTRARRRLERQPVGQQSWLCRS